VNLIPCAAAVGQAPPAEALRRLEELLRRLEPLRETLTTGTHFALLELSVTEAAALALPPGRE
jgi:hypothetical protein